MVKKRWFQFTGTWAAPHRNRK